MDAQVSLSKTELMTYSSGEIKSALGAAIIVHDLRTLMLSGSTGRHMPSNWLSSPERTNGPPKVGRQESLIV